MTQDEMKKQVAKKALDYVIEGSIIGVGTGSTVNFFIDELATIKDKIIGTVASSIASQQRLESHGISVFDLNEVEEISVYIDGADEINNKLHMIKGGGGALTREKIIASVAKIFVCIADENKLVEVIGRFPVPIEVIPMASNQVKRIVEKKIGGIASMRDFTTDNGNKILDITGLNIINPQELEDQINDIVGVVTNGIFARRSADILLLGTKDGVKIL